ncbi:MAG TPA: polynucleotide adenylyltransferase PcnB [Thermoanaerobaculia bacterium]|nr:polynucleotide adenylyltransferase PcnB [Thermoanaerobaculia bacterium]
MSDLAEPRVLARPEHPISRQNISPNALKVLYRLHQRGYKAYLVGGSVRDLMLGREPKDFDVGTDARPPEMRRLFRNSRIIGRRFRLVHVVFQGEVVEVATFRGEPDPAQQGDDDVLITSDNVYGTPRQDAFRRDFTINALFYDIADFSVIDYVGGVEDLERRVVRIIGDPDVRLQEDPVRMMRACEYAGRLGFAIEPATQEAIQRHRQKIELAAPARVTEEVLELLRCGRAGAALQWMLELGLLEVLLPEAYAMIGAGASEASDFSRLLPTIDQAVQEGRRLSDATLLGVLLLPQILQRRDDVEALDQRPMSRAAIRQLVEEMAEPFIRRFALSKNRTTQLLHALVGFQRLLEPQWTPRARVQMAHRPYFDDALDLFGLLVAATGEGQRALEQWRSAAARRGAPQAAEGRRPGARRRRRRPRRRRRAGGGG